MKELISIIIPLYNEEENVPVLLERLLKVLEVQDFDFEIILVDDGSTDRTFEAVRRLAAGDQRIKGIRFRRNHGQTMAIRAGFDLAQGVISITMDGDLQHDPGEIPLFIEKIREGYDMVCGFRSKRKDGLSRTIPSRAANFIARIFSGLKIKDFGSTYRAYRTGVIRQTLLHGEMHRFLPIFVKMTTDRITEIPISLHPRVHGRSKYSLTRTFRVFSDLFLVLFFAGFFMRPIHIFGYFSLLLFLPGFIVLACLSIAKILGRIAIMDYGPLFVLGVMLCLVAGQLFTTGIVCEYLVRIYYGNEDRKPYCIAEKTFEEP